MKKLLNLYSGMMAGIAAMMMHEYSMRLAQCPAGRAPDLCTAFDFWAGVFNKHSDRIQMCETIKAVGYDAGYEDGFNACTEYAVSYIRTSASTLKDLRGYRAADISAGMLSVANDLEEGCHEPGKVVI